VEVHPSKTARFTAPALIAVLVIAVIATFANGLAVPYLLDDFASIPGNPTIRSLRLLADVLFPPPTIYTAGRPVLNLSFALNYAIGGTSVTGYHVANILIHTLGAVVLFGLVRRTLQLPRLRDRFGHAAAMLAFVTAAVWAVHPIQVVSVTYLSQRAEALMALFYLLTLYGFVRGVTTGRGAWHACAMVSCALGMGTKEVMASAPIAVFLFDVIFVSGGFQRALRDRWRVDAGFAATWIIVIALTLTSELGRRAVGVEQGITLLNYLRIECQAVVLYLRLAIWPTPLIFDYGPNLPIPSWPILVLPGTILLVLLGFAIREVVRCRPAGFLAFMFFMLLAPTSSFIPIAGQPIAENRMYLPLALVWSGVVIGAYAQARSRSAKVIAMAVPALALVCLQRNSLLRSDLTIWRDTVFKQPVNVRAWVYYSEALKAAGRVPEAVAAMEASVRHRPDSAELANNLAVTLANVGRAGESVAYFQQAIRLKPDYAAAYFNFGAVLYAAGKFAPALECFQRNLALQPISAEANNYAGLCYMYLQNFAGAVPHFRRALEIKPDYSDARVNLELSLGQLNRPPAASAPR
jgi:protein O-mannosyl-transferase